MSHERTYHILASESPADRGSISTAARDMPHTIESTVTIMGDLRAQRSQDTLPTYLRWMSDRNGECPRILQSHATEAFGLRALAFREANGLVVVNSGSIAVRSANGAEAGRVNGGLSTESRESVLLAFGVGIPVVLTHGYPENEPDPLFGDELLRKSGVYVVKDGDPGERYLQATSLIIEHCLENEEK